MAGEAIGLLLTLAVLAPGCPAPCMDEAPDLQRPLLETDLKELPVSPAVEVEIPGPGPGIAPPDLQDLASLELLLGQRLPDPSPVPLEPGPVERQPIGELGPEPGPAARASGSPRAPALETADLSHPVPATSQGPQAQPHPVTDEPGLHAAEHAALPPATAAGLLVALAAIGLYHRLTKKRLLAHPGRQRILELLAEEPGMGTPQIAEALGCCYRTARHHLDKLAAFDMVTCQKMGHRTVWSLPRDTGRARQRATGRGADILEALAQEPGLHLSGLARRLSISKATAKHNLERLIERGLVEDERLGPLRCFRLTEDG